MISNSSLDAWKAYINCEFHSRSEAERKSEREAAQPFVTISRQAGAGGITVGEKLITFLREHDKHAFCPWTLFDPNLIATVLGEHNLPQEFAKFMPEDKVSETQDMMEELFGLHPSAWTLAHKTSHTILLLAQMGNVVLVGRGANVVTKKFLLKGFHVRLIGSPKRRVQHIQDYYSLTHNEAIEFIGKEDGGRKRYLKQNFDQDINDSLLYDLTINTDFISYDDTAELIGGEVLRIQRHILTAASTVK